MDAIAFAPIGPAREWSFRSGSRLVTIRPSVRFVANTAEVGAVVVTKVEKKSAQTRRVVLGFAEPGPKP